MDLIGSTNQQNAEQSTASLMKICLEMDKKIAKLEKDFSEFGKEMLELRKENAELRKENGKFERQISTLNREVAKLKGENRVLEWQTTMNGDADNTQCSIAAESAADMPIESAPNEVGTTKIVIIRQEMAKDSDTFQFNGNALKQEIENVETNGNDSFGQQIYYGNDQDFGDQIEQNEFIANEWENIEQKEELAAFEMDVDGEEKNEISLIQPKIEEQQKVGLSSNNNENDDNDDDDVGPEEIEFSPIRLGKTLLKCNWPDCAYRHKYEWYIRRHWRTHSGERPFVCRQCGQKFAQPGALKIHERIHSGERPYKCAECGEAFKQWTTLKVHERIHTGERPFACNECGQAFAQSAKLKAHMRTHTGECPYICNECGQAFKQSRTLREHYFGVHSGQQKPSS